MRPSPSALGLALALAGPQLHAQQAPQPQQAEATKTEPAKADPAKPAAAPAAAGKEAPGNNNKLERVEVSGSADDDAARRASSAAKIVIGREELMRYGDPSISETMKRLPGVTTGGVAGRGGDIRMRGMAGGYTQILVNGDRMPPGFSLETLPPEQVERIEILRAPTAEFGARAIAGTINIVLRQAPPARRVNDVRLGLTHQAGFWNPNLNWTRTDKLDEAGKLNYNLTASASQGSFFNASRGAGGNHDRRTGLDTVGRSSSASENRSRNYNLGASLTWRPANGEMLSIAPALSGGSSRGRNQFESEQTPAPLPGDPTSRYNGGRGTNENRYSGAFLSGQWHTRIGKEGKLESSASGGRFSSNFGDDREELKDQALVRRLQSRTEQRNSNWNLRSKLTQPLLDSHSAVAGLEASGTHSAQKRTCLEDGAPCSYLLDFGDNTEAGTRRLAAYAQDDWSVGKQWSFYAGLRWETITTESETKSWRVRNTSHVTTPLLHALYRLSDDPKKSRDQIRLSLTRSYRSPDLWDLTAQPVPNSYYPCPKDGQCTARNEYIYADWAGNAKLKPELATGLDLAYEQYLSKGGVLSANLFVRRIENLMRRGIAEEPVEWSTVPRWVSRPRNIGTALSRGLELEAKFRLDQFIDGALPLNVRSNLSLYRSAVSGIDGPHNRLAQQPRFTANLGGDYRLKSLPLQLGASLNFTPDVTLRQDEQVVTTTSRKRVFDAFAAWNLDKDTTLRLSAANLAPQDASNGRETVTPEKFYSSVNTVRTYTAWTLRLEMKL